MVTTLTSSFSDSNSDALWNERYAMLRRVAKHLVYTAKIPSWHGQEHDIVEDIVQESVRRIIERERKAQRDEAAPIESLEPMLRVTAYNYYRDLLRREWRFIHISDSTSDADPVSDEAWSFDEEAIENVYREEIYALLAAEIAQFPQKQRYALLVDLADAMYFDNQPTPLQRAFLKVGIHLEEYQPAQQENTQERGQRISLRNHAYKRILSLPRIQAIANEHVGNS